MRRAGETVNRVYQFADRRTLNDVRVEIDELAGADMWVSGEENDRRAGLDAPEFVRELRARHVGQFVVEQGHVKRQPMRGLERIDRTLRGHYVKAGMFQDSAQQSSLLGVVIHTQHGWHNPGQVRFSIFASWKS